MVYTFFDKKSSGSGADTVRLQINLLLNQIINLQVNFINSSLEKRLFKFIYLETTFGVLI